MQPAKCHRGLVAFVLIASSICCDALLKPTSSDAVKRRPALLLAKSAKADPFFRSEGVRSGVEEEALGGLGESGARVDSTLDNNWVTGSGMANEFRLLDNLEPVAPMDRLHAAIGMNSQSGHYMQPVYVPKYLNPESFPYKGENNHLKEGCECEMPDPKDPKAALKCVCPPPAPVSPDKTTTAPMTPPPAPGATTKPPAKAPATTTAPPSVYTWLRAVPIPGTNKFKLEPADLTYPAGNYWGPKTRKGLIAPADVLPSRLYPLQAIGDQIWPLPTSAKEDRIAVKFARYIDQVHDRSHECDTVSKECTVECKPGDEVKAILGNLVLPSKIVKTFAGNAVLIEFRPNQGEEHEEVNCPIEAFCSPFRYCKAQRKPYCEEGLTKEESHNWKGDLHVHHHCPLGTKACSKVHQVVMGNLLMKDTGDPKIGERACKAAPPG